MQEAVRKLLKSRKPQERIQGIKAIADDASENNQQILTKIAQRDPHKRVRDVAVDALKNLPPQARADALAEANLFLEEANNAMFDDKVKEARTYARRAFQLAPELQADDLARDVAVYIMKMNADDAIEHLLSDKDLFAVDRAFRKKMGYSYSDQNLYERTINYFYKPNVSLPEVLVDAVLYVVVITLPFLLIITLTASILAASFTAMSARRLTGQASLVYDYASTIGYGESAVTLGFAFIAVAWFGASLFLTFATQMVLTHFSANWFLGGNGSFYRLIHSAFIPVTLYSLFLWSTIFFMLYLYHVDLGLLVDSGMIEVINLVGFGVFIVYLSKTIGRVYDFDFGKGCLSLMFPYIVLFCSCGTIIGLRFGTEVRRFFGGG